MNCFKTCPLLTGVVMFSIIVSTLSFILKGTLYSEYATDFDPAELPFFVMMAKGVSDGVMPWDAFDKEKMAALNKEKEEAENALLADVSGNDVSANDVPEEEEEAEKYELVEVTDDYFTDALFIGDSRTVGLSEYCEGLDDKAKFYAKVSLSIHKVLEEECLKDEEGNKINNQEAIRDPLSPLDF